MKVLLLTLALLWGVGLLYSRSRPRPPGTCWRGPWRSPATLRFVYDLSYDDAAGRRRREERILPALLTAIGRAEHFIIIDIFLFNRLGGLQIPAAFAPEAGQPEDWPSPVEQLTGALEQARRSRPHLPILFITDEINTGYGSYLDPHLARLQECGVEVVITDLSRLRDPNPLYSGLWRPLLGWRKPAGRRGWLPNPLGADGPPMSLASWLRLFNFKANHRKLLITEQEAWVSSGNIHDGSALHSNIAFQVDGDITADLAAGELAVARFSAAVQQHRNLRQAAKRRVPPARKLGCLSQIAALLNGYGPLQNVVVAGERLPEAAPTAAPRVRVISDGAIGESLLAAIEQAEKGDRIWLGHFYLASRQIIAALAAAARRGVDIRLILDSCRDAFGHDKRGIPNRQSAARLRRLAPDNLQIRWYNTGGEQFHAKLSMVTGRRQAVVIGGSANLTRRNLEGYNLEVDLEIQAPCRAPVVLAVTDFFTRLWENREGHYTLDYEVFAEDSRLKMAWANWQEISGMGTF